MPATLSLPFDVARRGGSAARSQGRLGATCRSRTADLDGAQAATGLVEERERGRGGATGAPLVEERERGRGGATLDQVILGAWDELTAHASVACPVCRGKMVPRYGSEPVPVGGRCRRCGTTLG
ncbi:MAG: hypothetical protein QOJ82_1888 [Solirubrobacteraceae bacterium]|jgi:hypothetical protein|nr:hypothetical protein [Solirubrobacteraceae bacterium]